MNQTELKVSSNRGRLKKLFVYVLGIGAMLTIGVLIWASITFVYWGPDLPDRDFAGELLAWSAATQGADTNDHRLADAVELLYQDMIQVEAETLAIATPKLSAGGDPVLTTEFWDKSWTIDEAYYFPDPELGWEFTIPGPDPEQKDRKQADLVLEAFVAAGMLQKLDALLDFPGYVPRLRNEDLMELRGIREIMAYARIESLRGLRAAESRNFEDFIAAVTRLVQWRQFLQGDPRLAPQRMVQGTTQDLCELVLYVLNSGWCDDHELQQIADILASLHYVPMQEVARHELLVRLSLISNTHKQGVALKRNSRAYQSAILESCTVDMVAELEQPYSERNLDSKWYWGNPTWIQKINGKSVSTLLPAVSNYVKIDEGHLVLMNGLRMYVAVERYRIRHGALPGRIGEIDQDILPKPLSDPFADSDTFKYRIHDEPDRFGRDFTLYSVGREGKDDGGLVHSWSMFAGNPETDILINRPPWNYNKHLVEFFENNK